MRIKTILTLLSVLGITCSTWAQPRDAWERDTWAGYESYFRANELSIDVFGALTLIDERRGVARRIQDGRRSLGFGVNYYFTRHFGASFDGYQGDFNFRGFTDHASLSLLFRWPMDELNLAPYAFGGVGRQWDPLAQYTGHLGGGLDFRWAHNMGVFGDARYVFADKSRDFGLLRLGVRFVF
jgi:hypothetical protein